MEDTDIYLTAAKLGVATVIVFTAPAYPVLIGVGAALIMIESGISLSISVLGTPDQVNAFTEVAPLLSLEGLPTFIDVSLMTGNPQTALAAAHLAKTVGDLVKIRPSQPHSSMLPWISDALDVVTLPDRINSHDHDELENFELEDMDLPPLPDDQSPLLKQQPIPLKGGDLQKGSGSDGNDYHNGPNGGIYGPSGDLNGFPWSDNSTWPGGGGPIGDQPDQMLA